MKSKAQRPTKKIEEQERSKERSARESDLQQNADLQQITNLQQNTNLSQITNLQQNTDLSQNTVLQQNGFDKSRQIGPKTLLIQLTLFGVQMPKSFCIKDRCEN